MGNVLAVWMMQSQGFDIESSDRHDLPTPRGVTAPRPVTTTLRMAVSKLEKEIFPLKAISPDPYLVWCHCYLGEQRTMKIESVQGKGYEYRV